MTYRELLQLYKIGQLDRETQERVEADIQRQDAISEYLFDEEAIPTLEDPAGTDLPADGDPELVALIRRTIRRAFIRLGAAVCAIVLAGALLAVFVLPKAVDLLFYDPTEIVFQNKENPYLQTDRMSLDLSVWSEAFLPGAYRDNVIAAPRGYGAYDIVIHPTTSASGVFSSTAGTLVRDHLTLFDPNALRRPVGNAFVLPGEEDQGAFMTPELSFAAVDALNEGQWYQAYVSLSAITDYPAFYAWLEQLDLHTRGLWCAVYTEDGGTNPARNAVGFCPTASGRVMDWDSETYPDLNLVSSNADPADEETMTRHFLTMMQYLHDHPELHRMLTGTESSLDPERIGADIQENDLRLYGFSAAVQKADLLRLREDPMVNYLYTQPAQ